MAQATYHFPRGFLWGTATAAHQVEGNNTNNNWSAWEKQPGRIAQGQHAGLACDWWGGRWREDFDRAADAGQNAHRMSVEWSRIQPAPDRWDEAALDRYREMLRGLVERGMTPMVTLHHFSDPLWLVEQGGWENEQVTAHFEKFVSKVVEACQEYVNLWVTLNEPNVYAGNGYVTGDFPPGKHDLQASFRVMVNLVRAHAAAYHAIHKLQPQARVGLAIMYRGFTPAKTWSPLDRGRLGDDVAPVQRFLPAGLDGWRSAPSVRLGAHSPGQRHAGLPGGQLLHQRADRLHARRQPGFLAALLPQRCGIERH